MKKLESFALDRAASTSEVTTSNDLDNNGETSNIPLQSIYRIANDCYLEESKRKMLEIGVTEPILLALSKLTGVSLDLIGLDELLKLEKLDDSSDRMESSAPDVEKAVCCLLWAISLLVFNKHNRKDMCTNQTLLNFMTKIMYLTRNDKYKINCISVCVHHLSLLPTTDLTLIAYHDLTLPSNYSSSFRPSMTWRE